MKRRVPGTTTKLLVLLARWGRQCGGLDCRLSLTAPQPASASTPQAQRASLRHQYIMSMHLYMFAKVYICMDMYKVNEENEKRIGNRLLGWFRCAFFYPSINIHTLLILPLVFLFLTLAIFIFYYEEKKINVVTKEMEEKK